jgi:hypothetical protein
MREDNNHSTSSDIVWSAREIARAINRGERATFRLLETGALPARKVAGRWCANVTALRRALGVEQAA